MHFTQVISPPLGQFAAPPLPARRVVPTPVRRGPVVWRVLMAGLLAWLSFDRWTVFNTPLTGLDGSWAVGLHLAHGSGLRYGTDLVFTYGPLGWLISRLPIATVGWPLVLGDVVYLLHAGALLWLALGSRPHWTRLVLLAGLVLMHRLTAGSELPFVYYGFVLAYLGYHRQTGRALALGGAVGMAVFLFYLKANVGLVGLLSVVAYVLAQWIRGLLPRRTSLLTLVALVALTGLGAEALSVQLIPYLRAQAHLISSYNDVMYQPVSSRVLTGSLLLGFASGLLLGWRVWQMIRSRSLLRVVRADGVLLLLVGLQLFVLFKQGFVRADAGHVGLFYKYALLPLGLIGLFVQTQSLRWWAVLTAAVLAISTPWLVPFHRDPGVIYQALPQAVAYVRDVWQPLRPRLEHPPAPWPSSWLTRLAGRRVDVIPWHIDLIAANQLRYQPRPVMQSYQVTDAYLDSLNATFYRSVAAPDYVLYAFSAIDTRDPMADDSLTKLALLQHYRVEDRTNNWLLLRHKVVAAEQWVLATVRPAPVNVPIPVDTLAGGVQFWQIDLAYSMLGYGQRVLFQPPRLLLELTDQYGRVCTFRTAVPLLRAGLLLPAHPATLAELAQLFDSGGQAGGAKIVSVRIRASSRLVQPGMVVRQYKRVPSAQLQPVASR